MSMYAVVRKAISQNSGKTTAELVTITGQPADAVSKAVTQLVENRVVSKSGDGSGATYSLRAGGQ